jgi:hypothetical protein
MSHRTSFLFSALAHHLCDCDVFCYVVVVVFFFFLLLLLLVFFYFSSIGVLSSNSWWAVGYSLPDFQG